MNLGAGDRADAGDAEVDPLDLLRRVAGEVVAVQPAVLGVERGGDVVERGAVEVAVGHRHAHLERLAEVAQVGGALEDVLALGEPLTQQGVARLRRQPVVRRAEGADVERVVQGDVRLHVVVLHVDRQQAERRDVARVRRHQRRSGSPGCPSAGTAAATPSRRTWSG